MLDRLSKKKRNIALLVVLALIGWFFWTIRGVLNPLILGYLLAFVLHPAVLHLERKRGWGRQRAVNVIFLVAALFISGTFLGLYYQGREIVASVTAEPGKADVFTQAEERVDAFLTRVREWSERFSRKDEPKEGEPEEGESEGAPQGSTDARTEADAGAPSDVAAPGAAGDTAEEALPAGTAQPEGEAPADEQGEDRSGAAAEPSGESSAQEPPPTAAAPHPANGAHAAPNAAAGDPARGERPHAATKDLTVRELIQAWWKGYSARTDGGATALALENAPAVIVVMVNFFGSIMSLAALLLLLPLYSYFLLFELERIHRFVRRHVPKDERERLTRIGTQIGDVIANFFRGRLLVCVLKGAFLAFGLAVVGGPYPIFFGFMGGLLSLVPFVGPSLTFVLALVFGLQELSLINAVLRIGGVFLTAELLEGYVFIPKVLGDTLGLHPVVVLVSVFAGGAALGMFGLLIAIPLTAALVILAKELLLPALRQFADEDSHVDPPKRPEPS